MESGGITSFLRLKDVPNTCKRLYLREFFSAMVKSWKKLKCSNVFSSFTVCYNLNRSSLVREFTVCQTVSCTKINQIYIRMGFIKVYGHVGTVE